MKFSNDESAYYRPAKAEEPEWPPKYWKFMLDLKGEPNTEASEPNSSVAFVDARRLARIRLIDAKAEDMRKTTPLKENGPDPVIDKDVLTVEWLGTKLRSKKVPVKALLLDQGKTCTYIARKTWTNITFQRTSPVSATGSAMRSCTKRASTPSNTATPSPTSKSNASTTR